MQVPYKMNIDKLTNEEYKKRDLIRWAKNQKLKKKQLNVAVAEDVATTK